MKGLDVLSHGLLLDRGVTPGNPDRSLIWKHISSDDENVVMPPSYEEPMSDDEKSVIRQWIEDGAPPFPASDRTREFLTTADLYRALLNDLRQHDSDECRDLRYFSIHHLHNNATVSDSDLRFFRAGLSKLINSLSWQSTILLPEAIDDQQTIYRINLADLDWDRRRLWHLMLTQYPYGISYDSSPDRQLAQMAREVYQLTGCRIPVIRADWFVATASQPPLYHQLLDLPAGAHADRALEHRLGVDVYRDFFKNRLRRAGFAQSNVSDHNRLVDRHQSQFGAYWKSYDFGSSEGRQDLTDFPLGPAFRDNLFARHAFEHEGGEIIFTLPNGLQGYLLIDGDGNRIDRGPLNVVYDRKRPLGNLEVINGVSCMSCHSDGMQPFTDDVRNSHSLAGRAAQKVERLYPSDEAFRKLVEADAQVFRAAVQRATGAFLQDSDDPLRKEPVGAIASQYSGNLFLADIAAELNVEDLEELRPLFLHNRAFRRYGLAAVAQDKVVKRRSWDTMGRQRPYSDFQLVVEELNGGTPERVFAD